MTDKTDARASVRAAKQAKEKEIESKSSGLLSNALRSAIRAGMTLPDLINLGAYGAQKAAGVEKPSIPLRGSEHIIEGLQTYGGMNLPPPTSLGGRMLEEATAFGLTGPLAFGPLRMIGALKNAPAVSRMTAGMTSPVRIAEDVAMGAGVGGAQHGAEKAGLSPSMQLPLTLAGGLSGLAALRGARALGPKEFNTPFVKMEAAKAVRELDPAIEAELRAISPFAEGVTPTTAQAIRNPFLAQAEATAKSTLMGTKEHHDLVRALDVQQSNNVKRLKEYTAQIGKGDPEALKKAARLAVVPSMQHGTEAYSDALANFYIAAKKQVDTHLSEAGKPLNPLKEKTDPLDLTALKATKQALDERAAARFRTDVTPSSASRFGQELETASEYLPPEIKSLLDADQITFGQGVEAYQRLNREISKAPPDKQFYLLDLKSALKDTIEKSPYPELSKQFRQANAEYSRVAEKYLPTKVSGVFKPNPIGQMLSVYDPAAQAEAALRIGGAGGKQAGAQFGAAFEKMPEFQQAMERQFLMETAPGGVIDPVKSAKFFENYAPALAGMPEVSKGLSSLNEKLVAQLGTETAAGAEFVRTAATKSPERAVTQALAAPPTVQTEIMPAWETLMGASPEAQAALQSLTTQKLAESLGKGESLSPAGLTSAMQKGAPFIEKTFTPEQLRELETAQRTATALQYSPQITEEVGGKAMDVVLHGAGAVAPKAYHALKIMGVAPPNTDYVRTLTEALSDPVLAQQLLQTNPELLNVFLRNAPAAVAGESSAIIQGREEPEQILYKQLMGSEPEETTPQRNVDKLYEELMKEE